MDLGDDWDDDRVVDMKNVRLSPPSLVAYALTIPFRLRLLGALCHGEGEAPVRGETVHALPNSVQQWQSAVHLYATGGWRQLCQVLPE